MFKDRKEAGVLLSRKLNKPQDKNTIVLALPRGGVPVAAEIAKALNLPMNVLVVRKIGSPYQPEYGLGAVSEADTIVLDLDRMAEAHISELDLQNTIVEEKKELKRRIKLYRNNKRLNLKNKNIILVDDGLATGVTTRAAAIAAKKLGAKSIILASPVCATQSIPAIKTHIDKVVCLLKSNNLGSIGQYYENFKQVSDEEVISSLASRLK